MTLKQQAHTIIDAMEDEESIQRVIWFMNQTRKMNFLETRHPIAAEPNEDTKWQAFLKLETWKQKNPFPKDYDCEAVRRETMEDRAASAYGFSDFETEREAAMIEKYGNHIS